MEPAVADRYLARIGATRPEEPDLAALTDLMAAHLATVPFENLSIHLGEPIVLREEVLVAKIVDQRRGGFCYELNGAFAALLRHLGYAVDLLQARVHGDHRLGPPFGHMALGVDLPEGSWLVDVGFGRFVDLPFRLDTTDDQEDPAGTVALVPVIGPEGDLDTDVVLDGKPQYRLDHRPRDLDEFVATCWYQQTFPLSHFTFGPVCSLWRAGGRVTLEGRTLIETMGDDRTETELATDTEVLAAYEHHFGIDLDRVPTKRPLAFD